MLWSQTGFKSNVNLSTDAEKSLAASRDHFEQLKTIYGDIMCVNLMSRQKTQEAKLTQAFESVVRKLAMGYLRYEFFDFHEACKG